MKIFTDVFKPIPADVIADEQLYEAQRKLVEHEAAAEHHAALTEMYRRRVERLSGGGSSQRLETAAIDLKTGLRLQA
jgi:hypothetical protein